jgi:deazaflavin-dependent oxidoreductase (nitroreductase family)
MSAGPIMRFMTRMMERRHRRQGDKFMGMDLIYLTTIGAKSGVERHNPAARFDDGDGWLVCASAGGSVQHPGWYHNIAAHPDQVWAEVGGQRFRVNVEQLEGERRDAAWQKIVTAQPRFGGYTKKTDRELPVLRLTRAE